MFSFDGKSNKLFGIVVNNSNHLSKAKRKFEVIAVPGREDDLIIEDNTRENLNIVLECTVDAVGTGKKIGTLIDEIDTWLNVAGYKTLLFEDGTVLKACFSSEIVTEKIRNDSYGITLEFLAYKEVV